VSTQLAGALAVHAFRQVGPVGIAWGRIVFAAIALVLATRAFRIARPSRASLRSVVIFGVALAAMNSLFYLAIDRIPLGPAVTIEFWGPIAVAIATSHRRVDLVWAALALFGVLLLGGGLHTGGETAGVLLALGAGACWIVYILVGRRVAGSFEGATGLALAMVVAAVVLAPLGLVVAGSQVVHGQAVGYCAAIGILGSAIPYGLEQAAMRRVPARTFSVLLALHPAVAATVGALVLGQGLGPRDVVAIAAVVIAGAGAMRSAAMPRALVDLG
jgi:inner membrane transporter RhtA